MSKEARESREREARSDDVYQDRVINIARVAKVVKGGRRFSFSALIVVGDGKDKVGFGLGKANEVPDAIRKGSEQAKKSFIEVPKVGGTVPFDVVGRYGSATVLIYPAKKGKGINAGGAVRTIMDLAGVQDVVCKVHGTRNPQNVVRATFDGLRQLMQLEEYSKFRGKAPGDVWQQRHQNASTQPGA